MDGSAAFSFSSTATHSSRVVGGVTPAFAKAFLSYTTTRLAAYHGAE